MTRYLFPKTWCPWTSWSVCFAETCRPTFKKQKDAAEEVHSVYCVDKPPGDWKWKVYQLLETGEKTAVVPKRQRLRHCKCKTLNFIKNIFEPPCKFNQDVDWRTCHPNDDDVVYRCLEDKKVLSNCSTALEDMRFGGRRLVVSNLYAIIGGAVGAAAFVALLLCCIRFILAEVQQRRNGTSSLSLANQRQRNRQRPTTLGALSNLPLYINLCSTELPPAYKDVVPSTPISMDFNQQSQPFYSILPPSPGDVSTRMSEEDREQNRHVEGELLPSYHEVIALSHTAAHMHQIVLASQRRQIETQQHEQHSEDEPRVDFNELPISNHSNNPRPPFSEENVGQL